MYHRVPILCMYVFMVPRVTQPALPPPGGRVAMVVFRYGSEIEETLVIKLGSGLHLTIQTILNYLIHVFLI